MVCLELGQDESVNRVLSSSSNFSWCLDSSKRLKSPMLPIQVGDRPRGKPAGQTQGPRYKQQIKPNTPKHTISDESAFQTIEGFGKRWV